MNTGNFLQYFFVCRLGRTRYVSNVTFVWSQDRIVQMQCHALGRVTRASVGGTFICTLHVLYRIFKRYTWVIAYVTGYPCLGGGVGM